MYITEGDTEHESENRRQGQAACMSLLPRPGLGVASGTLMSRVEVGEGSLGVGLEDGDGTLEVGLEMNVVAEVIVNVDDITTEDGSGGEAHERLHIQLCLYIHCFTGNIIRYMSRRE